MNLADDVLAWDARRRRRVDTSADGAPQRRPPAPARARARSRSRMSRPESDSADRARGEARDLARVRPPRSRSRPAVGVGGRPDRRPARRHVLGHPDLRLIRWGVTVRYRTEAGHGLWTVKLPGKTDGKGGVLARARSTTSWACRPRSRPPALELRAGVRAHGDADAGRSAADAPPARAALFDPGAVASREVARRRGVGARRRARRRPLPRGRARGHSRGAAPTSCFPRSSIASEPPAQASRTRRRSSCARSGRARSPRPSSSCRPSARTRPSATSLRAAITAAVHPHPRARRARAPRRRPEGVHQARVGTRRLRSRPADVRADPRRGVGRRAAHRAAGASRTRSVMCATPM